MDADPGAVPVRLEVVPSAGLLDQLPQACPAPGSVSVTCLPHHGPARTVAASVGLARLGYNVVPHLAARSIASEAQLHGFLQQLHDAGVSELFVVAGDRRTPEGPYAWSGQLLEATTSFSTRFSIGIAGYPEGHPGITPDGLRASLESKAPLASSVVTQMCFSPEAISSYFDELVSSGVDLPVWVGVPGPVSIGKLLKMGARLGVGRSLKLARGTGMARALWQRRDLLQYDSRGLMEKVRTRLEGHPLFAGFHVYSFNDFDGLSGLLEKGSAASISAREKAGLGLGPRVN